MSKKNYLCNRIIIEMNDYDSTKRTSSFGHRGEEAFHSILAEAAFISYRTFESIQALAGTTYCKGVQIEALRKFAVNTGCWIPDISALGVFSDRGSENEVYSSFDSEILFKLNDFRYADDNLNSFFERISVHNYYFPDCAYDLIGFSLNASKNVCAVLTQPFVRSEREATEEEIRTSLLSYGFTSELDGEYYTNGTYDIFDAVPNNVLYGIDGKFYFIDTIYPTNKGGLNVYKDLSPRCSK